MTNNPKLEFLSCSCNQLTLLDIDNCTLLNELYCYANKITGELDFRNHSNLVSIDCGQNEISSVRVDGLTRLEKLNVWVNKLTEIDVSTNKNLKVLTCSSNQLYELDLCNNTELESLSCDQCNLTHLDVAMLDKLYYLSCGGNQLSSLYLKNNTLLEELSFENNMLTEIDLSKNKKLKTLFCRLSYLSKLDLSQNTELESLVCDYNYLNSLDLSMLPKLSSITCENNYFKINCSSKTIPVSSLSKYGFDPSKVISWNGITYDSGANAITLADNADVYSYQYNCGNGITCEFKLIPLFSSGEGLDENSEIISAVFRGAEIEVTYLDSSGNTAQTSVAAADVTVDIVAVMDIQNCIALVNYLNSEASSEEVMLTDGQLAAIEKVLEWDFRS